MCYQWRLVCINLKYLVSARPKEKEDSGSYEVPWIDTVPSMSVTGPVIDGGQDAIETLIVLVSSPSMQ